MSVPNSTRFINAIAAFDAYHKKDPNTDVENGDSFPSELLYARRMSDRLERYAPDAEEAVSLAARCQHIGRWEISRESFPSGRKGYLRWRSEERLHHARIAGEILSSCGYEAEAIEKVKALLLKKELHSNPASQLLEDVVCLVFIEFYLEDFAAKHDDEKVIDILAKTFKKMSGRGKEEALSLGLSVEMRKLMARAAAGF